MQSRKDQISEIILTRIRQHDYDAQSPGPDRFELNDHGFWALFFDSEENLNIKCDDWMLINIDFELRTGYF